MMTTKNDTQKTQAVTETGDDLAAAVKAAEAHVLEQRRLLADWKTRKADLEGELVELEQSAGTRLLDDPSLEESIGTQMGALQARVTLTGKAIAAQEPRVLAAESAYLTAQADAHAPAVAAAKKVLAKHTRRTKELLDALEEHECDYVPRKELVDVMTSSTRTLYIGGLSYKKPKSRALDARLRLARMHVKVLREMAAGNDPRNLPEAGSFPGDEMYPDCVKGPDALVPSARYLESVQAARKHVADLEELATRLPDEIRSWEQKIAAAGWAGGVETPGAETALARRCARLEELESELVEAKRVLAGLLPKPTTEDAAAPAA